MTRSTFMAVFVAVLLGPGIPVVTGAAAGTRI